jgi:hypothetical protein
MLRRWMGFWVFCGVVSVGYGMQLTVVYGAPVKTYAVVKGIDLHQ